MHLFPATTKSFQEAYENFEWDIPEQLNLASEVCDRHLELESQVAILYENEHGETAQCTYGDLKRWSNQWANELVRHGVQKGDRIAVVLSQSIELVVAHLAAQKVGAISVPLAILFGPEALNYRLKDSGAKVAFVHNSKVIDIEQMRPELPDLSLVISCSRTEKDDQFWPMIENASVTFEIVYTASKDPALLIYTSGTTGAPKGAVIPQSALIGNFPGFELSQNFFPQESDIFWTPADCAWTGGFWDALIPTLYYGKTIVAYESTKFYAEKAFELLKKYRITNAFIPPTALKMMRAIPMVQINRNDLTLRAVMSAGESVGAELIQWGEEALGVTINEMWGQTEFNYLAGNCSALFPPKPGSLGKPYPGHRVEVINEQGQVVGDGDVGELAAHIDDPVMFITYWNAHARAQEKITNGWFCTGDMGYRDKDGYLWFVGRKDDVINSAGYRIGPGEIEDSLLKHPAVMQAAVIGVPDDLRGEVVKAFIVLSPGHVPSDALKSEIQQEVRDRLSAHEYPREISFIERLPLTTTGKVMRRELRNLD
jgi:acetyl-CoA synthetase